MRAHDVVVRLNCNALTTEGKSDSKIYAEGEVGN